MLFESENHAPLSGKSWDPLTVRETIKGIVSDMMSGRLPQGYWPSHPLDESDNPLHTGFKGVYLGSAGVIWTLWYLQKEKAVELDLDLISAIETAVRTYQIEPDSGEVVPSLFLGEVGIGMVHWCLTRSPEVANRLYALIWQNIPNPTNEALWAAPGTMVAAWHLWEMTGEARWRALFIENIEQLWRTWQPHPSKPFFMWTQDMYGSMVQHLGASHGFAGNIYPLLRGASLLDAERREKLYDRCLMTLQATAVTEDGLINWPQSIGTPRPGRTNMLMQWCHGSPGVITSLAYYPQQRSSEMEAMLLAAGKAVWAAGPLSKGYGLCHGTAGNGYAFLKLYKRTSDSLWLDRARAFAMHAIEQRNSMRQTFCKDRYSLWTGDPGLAVYLWHCLVEADGLPAFDILD